MQFKTTLKLILITSFLLGLGIPTLTAQSNSVSKRKPFQMWMAKMDRQPVTRGYLREVCDSLIVVSDLYLRGSSVVYPEEIKYLSFRRKGAPGRGFLYGALGGMALGATVGYATAPSCGSSSFLCFGPGAYAGFGAALGLIGGTLGGAIVGGTRETYYIKGDPAIYESTYPRLVIYSLKF